MNIGVIATPNTKGQVVIPKKLRVQFGIDSGSPLNIVAGDGMIYLKPIRTLRGRFPQIGGPYLRVLGMTRGAWGHERDHGHQRKQRLEIVAARRRRRAW